MSKVDILASDVAKLKTYEPKEIILAEYHNNMRKCIQDILDIIAERVEVDPIVGALVEESYNSAKEYVNRVPAAREWEPISIEFHNSKIDALSQLIECESKLRGVKYIRQSGWEIWGSKVDPADGVLFFSAKWPYKVDESQIQVYVNRSRASYQVVKYESNEETVLNAFLDNVCPENSVLEIEPSHDVELEVFRDSSETYKIKIGTIRRMISEIPSARQNELITSDSWNKVNDVIKKFLEGYQSTYPFCPSTSYEGYDTINLPNVIVDEKVTADEPVIIERAMPKTFEFPEYQLESYPQIAKKLLYYVALRFGRDPSQNIQLPNSVELKLIEVELTRQETVATSDKIYYVIEDDTPVEAYSSIGVEYDQPFPSVVKKHRLEVTIDGFVNKAMIIGCGVLIGVGSMLEDVEILDFTPSLTVAMLEPYLAELPNTFSQVSPRCKAKCDEMQVELEKSSHGVWGLLQTPLPRAGLCHISANPPNVVGATFLEKLTMYYRKP